MVDLYESSDGENWQWKKPYSEHNYPWNVTDLTNQNPCSVIAPWQGVDCTEQNKSISSVISLRIDGYGLDGEIPSSIGNLTSLELFSLISNNLTGTIPFEIGNMTAMGAFYLSYNQLTGTIPSIGFMTRVKYLGLGSNQLTGMK